MPVYRIPVNSNVEIDTMTYLDKQVAEKKAGSRGEVIDRAVALLAQQQGDKAGEVTK